MKEKRNSDLEPILYSYFEGKKTVLDLGCGTMQHTREFISGRAVIGVDIWGRYRKPVEEAGAHFVKGSVLAYYRDSRWFDLVLMLDCLEHLEEVEAREMLHYWSNLDWTSPLVIYTTDGYEEQGPNDLLGNGMNPYQAHRCGFAAEELQDYGFTVHRVHEGLLATLNA